jgi:predicted RecA/RadA family phage recombinase
MASTYMTNMPGTTYHAVASGAVTAGDLVASAASDDVMTAITSAGYVESTVLVATATNSDDAIIVGVALTDAATGETLSVATSGLFIFESGAAVTAGAVVAQETTAQKLEDATAFAKVIGKALTGASASAKYVLVKLNI